MDDFDDLELLCSIADDAANDSPSSGNSDGPATGEQTENSSVEDSGQNKENTELGGSQDVAVMAGENCLFL